MYSIIPVVWLLLLLTDNARSFNPQMKLSTTRLQPHTDMRMASRDSQTDLTKVKEKESVTNKYLSVIFYKLIGLMLYSI